MLRGVSRNQVGHQCRGCEACIKKSLFLVWRVDDNVTILSGGRISSPPFLLVRRYCAFLKIFFLPN